MTALFARPRVEAIRCDRCDATVDVDAATYTEALQAIGAVKTYKANGSWARVPRASSWQGATEGLGGYWRAGGLLDLCPRCVVEENRKRIEIQAGS